jgi:predicted site-specific integrase-resolvase
MDCPKEILSPAEVEKLLSISHTTRIKWTNDGILKSYRVGEKRIYYKLSEVVEALQPINYL